MVRHYAVFDTNVLVSAPLTKKRDSATARVVDAIASRRIIPSVCFGWYREVIDRK